MHIDINKRFLKLAADALQHCEQHTVSLIKGAGLITLLCLEVVLRGLYGAMAAYPMSSGALGSSPSIIITSQDGLITQE